MKVIKGISLFFVYPVAMLLIGFWGGIEAERFFYPREQKVQTRETTEEAVLVSTMGETLCADTEYVLEEVDVLRKTTVETTRSLPGQYIGMDREQFLAAMEEYQNAPPLSEQKRGFEDMEVLSFSRDRVVVRMNYRYVQPGAGFYLAVQDHEVVVFLEDKKTLYINTGIMLEDLPDDLQLKIMQMHYVEGEGNLYNFLETYSS